MMQLVARHLMIFGRVQDVLFRNWAVETAQTLGLGGWVRNRADGSVEVQVEGPADTVDQFLALAHAGPPSADVSHIDSSDLPLAGLASFSRLPTR